MIIAETKITSLPGMTKSNEDLIRITSILQRWACQKDGRTFEAQCDGEYVVEQEETGKDANEKVVEGLRTLRLELPEGCFKFVTKIQRT